VHQAILLKGQNLSRPSSCRLTYLPKLRRPSRWERCQNSSLRNLWSTAGCTRPSLMVPTRLSSKIGMGRCIRKTRDHIVNQRELGDLSGESPFTNFSFALLVYALRIKTPDSPNPQKCLVGSKTYFSFFLYHAISYSAASTRPLRP
jgi:hypothetical protein